MFKRKTNRRCPNCNHKLIKKYNHDSRSGDKYICPDCDYSKQLIPTG